MSAVNSQSTLSVSTSGTGVSATAQLALLVAYKPPATLAIRATQLDIAVSTEGLPIPASSQLVMLVAYRTDLSGDLTLRAWTYSLDGHTFYVVTLGEQGTFVYDMTTGQWAKWQTAGYSSWNMEIGTTWKDNIIAADRENPIIWRLDPESFIDDDFKPQTRVLSGGLALRQRDFVPNYAFRITASVGEGDVPNTAPPTLPTVQLRYSDDQGKTFTERETLTLIEGNFTQVFQWLSLGVMQAPQRIFEITDTGAFARIGGADAEVEGEE